MALVVQDKKSSKNDADKEPSHHRCQVDIHEVAGRLYGSPFHDGHGYHRKDNKERKYPPHAMVDQMACDRIEQQYHNYKDQREQQVLNSQRFKGSAFQCLSFLAGFL
jgi:hypothetical protein